MSVRLRFLGATGTVTGSKTVVTAGPKLDDTTMVDCGLFQGLKRLRLKNWEPLPIDPMSIGSVILTHTHIDHSGYLPRISAQGFKGPIYCSDSSAELLEILLLDSAYLQEEFAGYANEKGFSKHKPALPLYTIKDATECLTQRRVRQFNSPFAIGNNFSVTLRPNGHILGSGFVELITQDRNSTKTIVFSGDLGRFGSPLMINPPSPENADVLIMESTYGDRNHGEKDPRLALREAIHRTLDKNGMILIPAFAVGRTQTLLYVIKELEAQKEIPEIPVFIDSPMGIDVTELYRKYQTELDVETRTLIDQGDRPIRPKFLKICRSREESIALNDIPGGAIIISSSGMATGGRILHHLSQRLNNPANTILLVGYQAEGTRGRQLQDGFPEIKIHGHYHQVRASIVSIDGFSAHADAGGLLTWLGRIPNKPRIVFLVHGERKSTEALAQKITAQHNLNVVIPEYNQEFVI